AELLWEILDVSRKEERAGIEYQDPECTARAEPVKLFREIAAEHAGSDDDCIERITARTARSIHFCPGIAEVATQNVIAERCLLNVLASGIRSGDQLLERHVRLLF